MKMQNKLHFQYSLLVSKHIYVNRPRGKESTEVRKSQIKGKESENSYEEWKRSPKDRHTQTHRNCIEIFRQAVNFILLRLRKMAVPVEISRYSLCVPVLR